MNNIIKIIDYKATVIDDSHELFKIVLPIPLDLTNKSDRMTKFVTENYLLKRFDKLVVLRLADECKSLFYPKAEIEISTVFEYVYNTYGKFPDCLIINLVPLDLFKDNLSEGLYQAESENSKSTFEFLGFKDISGTSTENKYDKYTLLYLNDIGGNSIISNMAEFW